MNSLRYLAGTAVLLAVVSFAAPASAIFHLWYIKEIYSNHDGSVQFIELFTPSNSQQSTNGEQITTGSNTFTFNANTGTPTGNKHLLLATAGFGSLPGGVAPNFSTIPLPPNFFNPAGDTINFIGADVKTFVSLPIDGLNSFNYTGPGAVAATTAANTPTNFAGTAGQVNLPPPDPDPTGDYNGDGIVDAADYVHWRKTLGETVSPNGSGADGSDDGTINEADYDYWMVRFGTVPTGSSGPIPEPTTLILSLVAWAILSVARRWRS